MSLLKTFDVSFQNTIVGSTWFSSFAVSFDRLPSLSIWRARSPPSMDLLLDLRHSRATAGHLLLVNANSAVQRVGQGDQQPRPPN